MIDLDEKLKAKLQLRGTLSMILADAVNLSTTDEKKALEMLKIVKDIGTYEKDYVFDTLYLIVADRIAKNGGRI